MMLLHIHHSQHSTEDWLQVPYSSTHQGVDGWELRTSAWFPLLLQVGCDLGLMVMAELVREDAPHLGMEM
jgi:hypothetical protein